LSTTGARRPASLSTGAGVWVVDKPSNLTSADVLRRLKKKMGSVRLGHAGTLDPMATGVLPVCLGEATKLLNYMTLEPKTYRGRLRFGLETDTWDITGTVLAERPAPAFSSSFLCRVMARQVGEHDLLPPMYSAIKHKGKPLYAYARRGQTVATSPRRTCVHAFWLRAREGRDLEFELICGRGTYVRSVVHALGRDLGCGACLVSLRRLRCGLFRIEHARDLAQMEALLANGRGAEALLSPEKVLRHVPACVVEGEAVERIRHGNPLRPAVMNGMPSASLRQGQKVRMMAGGRIIALAELRRAQDGFYWQPVRVLNHSDS